MDVPLSLWITLAATIAVAAVLMVIGWSRMRASIVIPDGWQDADAEILGWYDARGRWIDDEGDDEGDGADGAGSDDDRSAYGGPSLRDQVSDAEGYAYDGADEDDDYDVDADADGAEDEDDYEADGRATYPALRWELDGETYEAMSAEPLNTRRHDVGDELPIMYDPNDIDGTVMPITASISATNPGALTLMVGLGLLAIAVSALAVTLVLMIAL